jgi:hypothetical protein
MLSVRCMLNFHREEVAEAGKVSEALKMSFYFTNVHRSARAIGAESLKKAASQLIAHISPHKSVSKHQRTRQNRWPVTEFAWKGFTLGALILHN